MVSEIGRSEVKCTYVLMDDMPRLVGPSRTFGVSNNGPAPTRKGRRRSTRQRMILEMKGVCDSDKR